MVDDIWPRSWADNALTARQGMSHWGVSITGTGSYLPGDPISNAEFLDGRGLATSADWIAQHAGIVSRHHADPSDATSDLAAEAGRRAIAAAGIDASDIGRILLGSSTGDWTSPAAASRVQELLGARCPSVDVQAACASWMYSLEAGARLAATGVRNVLVVGADIKTRFVRRDDHRLFPVFGDGAGAVVLNASEDDAGFLQIELYTDGAMHPNIITPAGGSRLPASAETVAANQHSTRMTIDGRLIKEHAGWLLARMSEQVCAQQGITLDDVDWFVPHQANLAIMRLVADELGLDDDKLVSVIGHTGNTVSATLPIAFDTAVRDGRFRPGQLVLLATAGAGYAAGAALYRMPT